MEILKWVLVTVGVLFVLLFLIFARKTKSAFKTILLFACSGVSILFLLFFLKPYIGLQLSVNPFTVGISAALGIPGVIGIIVAPMLF
ncbi:MAG: pro-sigmaK processing inhibitor BofA family protein [Clostridia bacterium]|nr:pro-sigmaK processing inhibitor BofA family protein [Clostridia bacterium]